ncbi:hypothetical protein AXE80_00540 [Wenyingzhuangia fucanilytica]|uniref:Uncharacterized protein n=1 Tax=Wenyingzhuangia fucanilytica TaxID=1790137 RepID=A0A1B1Y2A0_9FLAO|nr:hypothetical protein [Wenyingzhuangia fucanilytica]ANW94870.1 hypothetical protein AXE80_00540 [Wenyingzhuangia fucanilytica]
MKNYLITVFTVCSFFLSACSSGEDSQLKESELTIEQKEFIALLKSNYPTQVVSFNAETAIENAPYTSNQKLTLTFSSSGMLFIDTNPEKNDGDEIELPVFSINGNEYIWKDIEHDLTYALSLTAENYINEINVFKTSTNTFYASLVTVAINENPSETNTESYYFFGDDNMECTPISQGKPLVSTVHIISNPCQSSSAALTFYFDLMKVINAGTYTVLASEGINVVPGAGKLTMVFYSHDAKNWFAQSGTVTVTTNSDDASKIDLKFKDILMKAEDGTETTFTGQIIGV